MSVISEIKEFRPGWGGGDSSETRQYTVTVTDSTIGAAAIIEADETPKVGDKLTGFDQYVILDGGIQLTRIDEKADQWRMTIVYTKTGFAFASRDDSDRLLSFAVKARTYTHTVNRAYEYVNTSPLGGTERSPTEDEPTIKVETSAKDEYDPADLQDEYYNTVLTWTQRENRNFDYIGAIANRGTLNKENTTILGIKIAGGAGLLRDVSPVLSTDESGDFEWSCTYAVEIAHDGDFWLNILDRGFYAIIDGAKKEITNADIKRNRGEPPTSTDEKTIASSPQLLDGSGLLAAWSGTYYTSYFLRYRTKRYLDWSKTLNMIEEEIRTG